MTTSAGTVVSRIESILEAILDCVAQGQELSIDFVSNRSGLGNSPQTVRFPGRTAVEATKFARILLILQLAHDALVSGTVLTKRHIFYQHQGLFVRQRTVDELVDNLASALNVRRDDLNIVASSKGVFSGPLSIRLQDNTVIGPTTGDVGIALPSAGSIVAISCETIRWILIVEKDATYRSLTSCLFWQTSCLGPGLLITAKGYPDMLTCAFVQLIRFNCPHITIFVLADYDPDGLNILRHYRLKSEIASEGFTAPAIRWLGIKSQSSKESTGSKTSISSTECREPISPLSTRDRNVAVGILKKLVDSGDDPTAVKLGRELQVMLMMGIKAEIQWLDEAGNLTEWLDTKIGQMLLGA
ncbi:type IIB DNA topoisomerase domain-containing protein [Trichoderma breve]|uniref:DNA topoisomerase (ATP-hydrolyzing) n=1 Tax=Trichoderma breve TaxID=2034170 RepID=A0A9W9EBL0_9HYPO|nr:type IIB DNA topoisomerase domain-containing protein [Trichoderma breve]KAJ4863705.1 type IIB DNA topoisomerase domain-containing protein [Trichoderma breve]